MSKANELVNRLEIKCYPCEVHADPRGGCRGCCKERQEAATELRRLEKECDDWRTGVLLIAGVFDMKHACCATIFERVLEQKARIEELENEVAEAAGSVNHR